MTEYVVTAGKLNFRSSASSLDRSNIIATLLRGHLLQGDETPAGGGWLGVTTRLPAGPGEVDGFVSAQYAVATTDPSVVPPPPVGAGVPPVAGTDTVTITLEQLRKLAPTGKDLFLTPLALSCIDVRAHYGLDNSALTICHFLAQLAHEAAGFRTLREYWGPTSAQRRYEGRADLGNTHAGDGKRFMGRGYIQVTGRANYTTYGGLLGLALTANPMLAEDPLTALNIACLYWKKRGIDGPAGQNDLKEVTRRINGGQTGYAERRALFLKARTIWP